MGFNCIRGDIQEIDQNTYITLVTMLKTNFYKYMCPSGGEAFKLAHHRREIVWEVGLCPSATRQQHSNLMTAYQIQRQLVLGQRTAQQRLHKLEEHQLRGSACSVTTHRLSPPPPSCTRRR